MSMAVTRLIPGSLVVGLVRKYDRTQGAGRHEAPLGSYRHERSQDMAGTMRLRKAYPR